MSGIKEQIRAALDIRGDIYAPYRGSTPDQGYPDTHLDMTCIKAVFDTVRPTFWLEFGSMVGGSATKVCRFIKGSRSDCQIVCVDPFCGSVDMWMWESLHRRLGRWLYLNLDGGFPTIRERFMANVCSEGCDDLILPIQATTMVGAGVVKTLFESRSISTLPQAIYLDSAHIEKETHMELEAAWDIVAPGGVLFGDDWTWDAVRNDVLKFSDSVSVNEETKIKFLSNLPGCYVERNVVLAGIHWFLFR
jgi:hypothetical protein